MMTLQTVPLETREAVLEIENLRVDLPTRSGQLHAVRGVDIRVALGETVCIVGESGCGKSMTSLAIMGLLPPRARCRADRLAFAGRDLRGLSEAEMSNLRGNRMAMIFQEPMTALNPVFTLGDQLTESLLCHHRIGRRAAREKAVDILERVGISGAAGRLEQYPHQLSGGLRQRVVIAMALICEPQLVIADEPTTALDVTIQAQILHLLKALQTEIGMGMLFITHDLGLVSRIADRVVVMYAGEVVETGTVEDIFDHPAHPYTRGLLQCLPSSAHGRPGARLGSIPGIVPSLIGSLEGCGFRGRCPAAIPECANGSIPLTTAGGGQRSRCLFAPEEIGPIWDVNYQKEHS